MDQQKRRTTAEELPDNSPRFHVGLSLLHLISLFLLLSFGSYLCWYSSLGLRRTMSDLAWTRHVRFCERQAEGIAKQVERMVELHTNAANLMENGNDAEREEGKTMET